MKEFPTGVVRHMGFSNRPSVVFDYATYPWVTGTIVQEFWSALQPTAHGPNGVEPTDIDYSYLDGALTQATLDQKPVIFLVKTGGGSTAPADATPSWITGAPYSRPHPTISGGTDAWPWDHVSQMAFFDLVRHLGKRYDGHPWLRGVYISGCQTQYPEMFLEGDADAVWQFGVAAPTLIAGYAAGGQVYIDAWKRAINVFAQAFPNTPLVAMLDKILNPLGAGTLDEIFAFSGTDTEPAGVLQYIESKAAWREQFVVGTANLADDPTNTAIVEAPIGAATTDARYGRLRAHPVQIAAPYTVPSVTVPLRLVPIFYEIGFQKLSGTPDDLYRSLQVAQEVLGCRAAMVAKDTWNTAGKPAEALRASRDFWSLG